MQLFNAVVKNGRLTLNEPCPSLTENEVVVLLPLNELLAVADGESVVGTSSGSGVGGNLMFEIASGPPRGWRKPERVDAASLIDELRSLE